MRLEPLPLTGTFKISLVKQLDNRGFFARTMCEDTLVAHGLVGRYRQSSVSFNNRRGTVRGMHYALEPHGETKIVRCTAGAIHDVIVDLRINSSTYLRSVAVKLTAQNGDAVYIPKGFAHGFQTLTDATEVLYLIDQVYVAEAARGLRWNDPALDIKWPEPVSIISDRDLGYADWQASTV